MVPQLSLNDWLEKIESLHAQDIDLGLERCRQVYDRLLKAGCISRSPYTVTLAGTNGKGTTLQFIENAALSAGLSVGSYTSPHLFKFNERLRIDGVQVADQSFVDAFELVAAHRQSVPLTYYEFTTLAVFIIMSRCSVDLWLLEVGLGGRLDTVNLIDADLAVVTSVALDHQAYLGDTREQIGLEKIQIARPFGRVFIGGDDMPKTLADYVVQNSLQCFNFESRNMQLDKETKAWSLSLRARESHAVTHYDNLPMPHIPMANAALAIQVWLAAARDLEVEPWKESMASLIERTQVFGRFTLWSTEPEVWLDAAHNPAAAALLASTLKQLELQKTVAFIGIMADKDVVETLKPMLDVVDHWRLWPLSNSRALPVEKLKRVLLELGVRSEQIEVAAPACLSADLREPGRYLVFGSFFTLEAFVSAFQRPLEVDV